MKVLPPLILLFVPDAPQMETALAFAVLAALISLIVNVIRCLMPSRRASGKRWAAGSAGLMVAGFVAFGIVSSRNQDQLARDHGFIDANEMRAASAQGINEPAEWRAKKAELDREAERIKSENEKKAAIQAKLAAEKQAAESKIAAARQAVESENRRMLNSPEQFLELTNFSWRKEGFGNIMEANFTIINNSNLDAKDIEISCQHSAPSGTVIDSNTRTLYEIVRSKSRRSFQDFSMGFIHSQAQRTSCRIREAVAIPKQ